MKTCVLSSGGMDSFLLHRLFAPYADQIFVDIGQPYYTKEFDAMRRLNGTSWILREASQIAKQPDEHGIILHRNALLILTAALTHQEILLGVLAHEINSDKSIEFFEAMATVLNISHLPQYWNNGVGKFYRVHSPIRVFTKSELVKLYVEQKYDVDMLLETVSCYNAQQGHCGACASCFKRWVALTNNYLAQPGWRNHPRKWAEENSVITKALSGVYDKGRSDEILMALERHHPS